MPESTAKKQLLQQDFLLGTPAKLLVARDINSWMQTNQKSIPVVKRSFSNAQAKFKISKKLPPKQINIQTKNQLQQDKISPSLQELRKRRDDLMKSQSNNKKWSYTKTKPNSIQIQGTTGQSKKPYQWFARLPLVHVNEFIIQQNEKIGFQQISLIPQMRPFTNKSTNNAVRKLSLKRLQKKQHENIPFLPHKQLNKKSTQMENKNILQQKANKNMYAGLRNNLKKGPYLNFILNQQN